MILRGFGIPERRNGMPKPLDDFSAKVIAIANYTLLLHNGLSLATGYTKLNRWIGTYSRDVDGF